jgi:hypothetical protein
MLAKLARLALRLGASSPVGRLLIVAVFRVYCFRRYRRGNSQGMRILYVDNFRSTYASMNTGGLFRAFNEVADVARFDGRFATRLVGGATANRMFRTLADYLAPKIIYFGKNTGIKGSTVADLKNRDQIFAVQFFGDLLLPAELQNRYAHEFDLAKSCDIFLKMQDDERVNSELESEGIRHKFWMSATDPKVFYPRDVARLPVISFMANNMYKRQGHEERRTLVQSVIDEGLDLHVYGNNWEYLDEHPNLSLHEFVGDEGFANAASSAAISLNYNGYSEHPVNKATSWRRVFNGMACESLVLTLYFPGLEHILENNKHLVWFHSIPEAIELMKYFLEHEDERLTIAQNGAIRVRESHGWDARVQDLLGLERSSALSSTLGRSATVSQERVS